MGAMDWGALVAVALVACTGNGQAKSGGSGSPDASGDAAEDASSRDSGAAATPEASLEASDDAGCEPGDACACGPGCCPGTTAYDYGTPCTYDCNCLASAVGKACITGVCGSTYGQPCGTQVGFSYPIPCAQGTCKPGFNGMSCQQ